MAESRDRSEYDEPISVTVECGSYSWRTEVLGPGQAEVTRGVFESFATVVDDPEIDPDRLGAFLAVTIEETGQLWVFPADAFLQNLLHRRGDQSKARRALQRLADQEPDGESDDR